MEISKAEVLLRLREWQQEKTSIKVTIGSGPRPNSPELTLALTGTIASLTRNNASVNGDKVLLDVGFATAEKFDYEAPDDAADGVQRTWIGEESMGCLTIYGRRSQWVCRMFKLK